MGSHISEIKKNMYSEIAEALTTAMLPKKGEKRKKTPQTTRRLPRNMDTEYGRKTMVKTTARHTNNKYYAGR